MGTIYGSGFVADMIEDARRGGSERPELPEPLTIQHKAKYGTVVGYTAAQMHSFYAKGLADGTAAERGRCAKLCEAKVMREAGYGGSFGGYGPMEGDLTGPECAAAIRNDAVKEPQ